MIYLWYVKTIKEGVLICTVQFIAREFPQELS